jgi:hypothetical protein
MLKSNNFPIYVIYILSFPIPSFSFLKKSILGLYKNLFWYISNTNLILIEMGVYFRLTCQKWAVNWVRLLFEYRRVFESVRYLDFRDLFTNLLIFCVLDHEHWKLPAFTDSSRNCRRRAIISYTGKAPKK